MPYGTMISKNTRQLLQNIERPKRIRYNKVSFHVKQTVQTLGSEMSKTLRTSSSWAESSVFVVFCTLSQTLQLHRPAYDEDTYEVSDTTHTINDEDISSQPSTRSSKTKVTKQLQQHQAIISIKALKRLAYAYTLLATVASASVAVN